MTHIYKIICLCLLVCPLAAQVDTTRSAFGTYYFEGEDVIFEFDQRNYDQAVRASDGKSIDFGEINLSQIAISGNFNNWSWEGWKMNKVSPYHYTLRKKVSELNGDPNWQFKFVINSNYWVTPNTAKEGALLTLDLSNPDKNIKPHPSGNTLFQLEGYTDRKQVILAGTFNHWQEHDLEMQRTPTGWELRLQLKFGTYEYKFIADGEWIDDPANPDKIINEHQTFNSVIHVTKTILFQLKGFDTAKQVILSGSFNDWNKHALAMHRNEQGWSIEVPLTGGKHLYKFIVDGQWMIDPDNKKTETTWDGYENSVRMIRQ